MTRVALAALSGSSDRSRRLRCFQRASLLALAPAGSQTRGWIDFEAGALLLRYAVESSASLASEAETHGEYYASQYTAYLNRFDAGMVIYWYGYDAAADTDPRVLLADGFPAECELMSHMQLPRRQSSGAIVGGGGET